MMAAISSVISSPFAISSSGSPFSFFFSGSYISCTEVRPRIRSDSGSTTSSLSFSADVWIPAPARLAWAERKSSRSRFVREAGIRSINPLGYLGYRVPPWSSPEPIAPWDRPSPIGLRCGGSGVGLVRGLEPSPPEGPARLRRRCEPGAAKATAARLTGGWRVCYDLQLNQEARFGRRAFL